MLRTGFGRTHIALLKTGLLGVISVSSTDETRCRKGLGFRCLSPLGAAKSEMFE
jgi:hypothetical protein